MLSLLYPIVRP